MYACMCVHMCIYMCFYIYAYECVYKYNDSRNGNLLLIRGELWLHKVSPGNRFKLGLHYMSSFLPFSPFYFHFHKLLNDA